MTIFAGIIARKRSVQIKNTDREYLAKTVSRFEGEVIEELSGARFHFVKVDIGAFGAPGMCKNNDSVALLTGEPLLSDASFHNQRDEDLRVLQHAINNHEYSVIAKSSGTFCAAFFDPTIGELTLVADKFGVRPIYYWIGEDFSVFSTALRVIQGMAVVPKALDVLGVTEEACFGFPLADRTPYSDIKTIRESEIVVIDEKTVKHQQYWRWDHLKPYSGLLVDAARTAHEQFVAAVKRRLGSDNAVAAFLSGGLDSRAVVAALRQLDVVVHTANMSDKGSQDYVFGAQVAKALGCHHKQVEPIQESVGGRYLKQELARWLDIEIPATTRPTRQHLMWGGDGGSVGMGYVYLTNKMVELIRAGRDKEAVAVFLEHNSISVPKRVLNSKIANEFSGILNEGILAELKLLNCSDSGRNLHLFLMFNDQRRHLAGIYENIDIDRIELQLPFFDANFMESVLCLPLDSCLRHVFYMQWLEQFIPAVVTTPWQAYPGHVPCLIPPPEKLNYQWTPEKSQEKKKRKGIASQYRALVESKKRFPSEIISSNKLSAAYLLTYAGIRDFSYALRFATVVLRHWKYCDGLISFWAHSQISTNK